MKPLEVHLVALDVLEGALTAGSLEELVDQVKPDLEVLPRGELIRLAMATAAEAVTVTPVAERLGMLRRVGQRRLAVMMDGS